MLITIASRVDPKKWDAYIINHPDSSPYHLFSWGESIRKAYGHEVYHLLAEEEENVVGVLMLILIAPPLCPRVLVSLPFCDVGAPLTDNLEVTKALLEKVVQLGRELKIKKIDIRGNIEHSALAKLSYPHQVNSEKVRMLMQLPSTSEELWRGFKSKLRSQVSKAGKNGLEFSFADNIDDFYPVFCENMRDLGSPVHSRQWIKSIVRNFGENAKVGVVSFKGEVIGAGIILTVGSKVSIPWASTLRAHNRLNPNMLLYWNFLKFSADNGFKIFDFGRSTPDEGTYKFKKQWGAEPFPLNWQQIILHGKAQSAKEGKIGSCKRELAAKYWQKLPLGLANFIGPLFRKYISL